MTHIAEYIARQVGQIDEHAAARASRQMSCQQDPRPIAAQSQPRVLGRGRQRGRTRTGLQLIPQPLNNGRVMVHERQPAQGTDASRQQRSRDAIEHQRIEPRGNRNP